LVGDEDDETMRTTGALCSDGLVPMRETNKHPAVTLANLSFRPSQRNEQQAGYEPSIGFSSIGGHSPSPDMRRWRHLPRAYATPNPNAK